MQIYNGKRWLSCNANFTIKRGGSLVMQLFVIGTDGSIIMQNCRDRIDYIRGCFAHAFRGLQIYD